jgi:hypothetical protein
MAPPDIHQRLVDGSQKPRTVLGRLRHRSDLASEGMHRALLSRDPRNSRGCMLPSRETLHNGDVFYILEILFFTELDSCYLCEPALGTANVR